MTKHPVNQNLTVKIDQCLDLISKTIRPTTKTIVPINV